MILNKESKKTEYNNSACVCHKFSAIQGKQNQVVVMFQTESSKNTITRRF